MKDNTQENLEKFDSTENSGLDEMLLNSFKGDISQIENNIPFLEKTLGRLMSSGNYPLFEEFSISILNHLDKNPSQIGNYMGIFGIIFCDSLDISASRLESRLEAFTDKYNDEYGFI